MGWSKAAQRRCVQPSVTGRKLGDEARLDPQVRAITLHQIYMDLLPLHAALMRPLSRLLRRLMSGRRLPSTAAPGLP